MKAAQRSNDITYWINYFVVTVLIAQIDAKQEIEFTLKKTKFFEHHKNELNKRQQKLLRRMLEEGHQGFEWGMNVRKCVSIASTSKATATRDLQDLVRKDIFKPIGGGRSALYEINFLSKQKKLQHKLKLFSGLDGTRTLLGEPCRCGTSAKYFYLC